MKIPFKSDKTLFIYKRLDGSLIQTGAYFSDSDLKNPINPKGWDYAERIEINSEDIQNVYLEQCEINNGTLYKDLAWEKCLMPIFLIKLKYKDFLNFHLDQELDEESPDPIKVIKLQRSKEKIKDWTELDTYQQALKNLDEKVQKGEADKPVIRQKLQAKIAELNKP